MSLLFLPPSGTPVMDHGRQRFVQQRVGAQVVRRVS